MARNNNSEKLLQMKPLIPYLFSFSRRILWFTVSNALAKSKKTRQVNRLLSIAFVRLFVISAIASSVERPFLNPIGLECHTFQYNLSIACKQVFQKFVWKQKGLKYVGNLWGP